MVPLPVDAVPEIVAGPSGLIPLLRRGVTPVFMVLRFAHCTCIPPCCLAAGEVPSAVNRNAVWPARAPGAGILVGPGTVMADPTESPYPPMHLPETDGQ